MSLFSEWVNKTYIWVTEQLYHQFAWAYEVVARLVSFGNWSDWRRDALEYLGSGKVLEIGFGTGALLSEMTNLGYEVFGLEQSPQMLKVAQRKFRMEGRSLKVVQAKTQAVPFSDCTFENIISTFPSNYIYHDETLWELARVAKPDGRVVVIGFGVEFKSGIKNWLTSWFLNKGSDAFIELMSKKADVYGFNTKVVTHREEAYILPIMIMEKSHED